uniref:Uncharacterized protein n=1 Tax=Coccidioides posadasii RMSCC 3488 TaxID=454284 RepID=A0A0J6FF85_COCPO|nr:hypothetical protein CPAG_08142 [Coccidioides posadasii RMSCC 3488]
MVVFRHELNTRRNDKLARCEEMILAILKSKHSNKNAPYFPKGALAVCESGIQEDAWVSVQPPNVVPGPALQPPHIDLAA